MVRSVESVTHGGETDFYRGAGITVAVRYVSVEGVLR